MLQAHHVRGQGSLMGPFLSCGELPGIPVLLLRKCILSCYKWEQQQHCSFSKKKFYVYGCSACIYVCACVCPKPIASKARRSCIPLAGSRTRSTETVVSLLFLHHSLPFLNASQIRHLTTVSSGQLFSVCSGDAHYHLILEQFPSQGTVTAMKATGQRVLGKRKMLRA